MAIANQNLRFSEVLDDVRNIVYGAWRYRWKGIGLVWLLCVCGWMLVMSLPNIYEASSRLFIDTTSRLNQVLQGEVVNTDTVAEANIMVRSITSRPSLEAIAARTGMMVGGESASEVASVVRGLLSNLEISLDMSQVLQVTYRQADQEIALAVVSQLIDAFVEGLLVVNRSDSDTAQDFLEQKLGEYEQLLDRAETRLADFKKKNIGQMPGEHGDYFARLQQEQEVLNGLNFQLRLSRERQAELSRQLVGEAPVFGITLSPTATDMGVGESTVDRQIQKFQQELAVLRVQYTDSHPDIVRINAILEDLREQQKDEQSKVSGRKSGSLEENPFYQNMKIQLSTVELELIELESRRANQVRVVNDLRDKVDVIPDIEANLTRLNRDYEVNKSQYEALLRRLETARMTEAAEKSKTQYEFRVIDPPAVSPSPVGPNRVLFMTAVLILSIGAGVMFTIFLSFTRPVFFSMRSLEQRFGIPVLGGIRYVSSAAEIAAARLNFIVFLLCFGGVLSIYGFVVSFEQAGAKFIGGLVATLGSLT